MASSADTPKAASIAWRCLELLEVVPGISVMHVLRTAGGGFEHTENIQIGRHTPLSSDKARSHFPRIRAGTGIEYSGMLFFDDANWDDNIANVERHCHGVVGQRTPHGMSVEEFEAGLRKFAHAAQGGHAI